MYRYRHISGVHLTRAPEQWRTTLKYCSILYLVPASGKWLVQKRSLKCITCMTLKVLLQDEFQKEQMNDLRLLPG